MTAGRDVEAIDAQREQAPQRLDDAAFVDPLLAPVLPAPVDGVSSPAPPASSQAIDVTAVGSSGNRRRSRNAAGSRSASSSKRRLDDANRDPARRRARRRPALPRPTFRAAPSAPAAASMSTWTEAGCSPAASAERSATRLLSARSAASRTPRSRHRRRPACPTVRRASRARAPARSALAACTSENGAPPRRRIVIRWTVFRSKGGSRRVACPRALAAAPTARGAHRSARTAPSAAATTASPISPRGLHCRRRHHVTAPAMTVSSGNASTNSRNAQLTSPTVRPGAVRPIASGRRRRALRDRTATRSRTRRSRRRSRAT